MNEINTYIIIRIYKKNYLKLIGFDITKTKIIDLHIIWHVYVTKIDTILTLQSALHLLMFRKSNWTKWSNQFNHWSLSFLVWVNIKNYLNSWTNQNWKINLILKIIFTFFFCFSFFNNILVFFYDFELLDQFKINLFFKLIFIIL